MTSAHPPLFRSVDHAKLLSIFTKTSHCSPIPYLTRASEKAKAAIRRRAQRSALWQELNRLDVTGPIPVLSYSTYREYRHLGRREPWEIPSRERQERLRLASQALWLNHPKANREHLQNLLWAVCEEWTWVLPAHEPMAVDLGAAMCARLLAETVCLHRTILEPEVITRVTDHIQQRIWNHVFSASTPLWWRTIHTNWNHVCWGETILTALYLIDDPIRLTDYIHPAVSAMTYGLDGFTDDGGCVEGPSYWDYGFGHFAKAALGLYHRTDGQINLMTDERCQKIARFPLASSLRGQERALFADCKKGYLSGEAVVAIQTLAPTPELLAFCRPDRRGHLDCRSLMELALTDDRTLPSPPSIHDALLPNLGLAKIQGRPGPQQLTLFCLGGHNGVPHNHNDLGSFILYKGNCDYLTDPGGPRYTKDTFGAKRYDNVYCHARGHSIPIVNGVCQEAGSEYFAQVSLPTNLNKSLKTVVIDLSQAYPKKAGIHCYLRTFTLDTHANSVSLTDSLSFSKMPHHIDFQFISLEPVSIQDRGRSVRIGDTASSMNISTTTSGTFSREILVDEAADNHKTKPIQRITFRPKLRSKTMTITFSFTF